MSEEAQQQTQEAPAENEVDRLRAENRKLREESAERRVTAKRLEDEKLVVASRLKELEPYEATVKEEVATLRKELGDRSKVIEGVGDAQALRVLREMKALAAGPGAARTTTAGNPPPPKVSPDLAAMNTHERRTYLQSLSHDELMKLNGGAANVSPLAHAPRRS